MTRAQAHQHGYGSTRLARDGEDSVHTVAVTSAVLQSIDERRIVTVAV